MSRYPGMMLYAESIGGHSSEMTSALLEGVEPLSLKVAGRVGPINLWPVSEKQLEVMEESRRNDANLHFSLWGKYPSGTSARLLRDDVSYSRHIPDPELLRSLTNGSHGPANLGQLVRKQGRVIRPAKQLPLFADKK